MRLDFLHNYPLNPQANAHLLQAPHPNASIFIPQKDAKAQILESFGAKFWSGMAYDALGFMGLFSALEGQIAYGIGNHQQIVLAAENLEKRQAGKCYALGIDRESGVLESEAIEKAVQNGCRVFFIPAINQDILTRNPIEEIFTLLAKNLKDFLLLIDISLSLSLGERVRIWDSRVGFLINGESLGVLRGQACLLTQAPLALPFVLETQGSASALWHGLNHQPPTKPWDREAFLGYLQEELGECVGVFAPLDSSATCCISLRFSGIKARLLLQDLFIQGIYGVNGQECLFGLFQPSFVLQKMGYSQEEARELLSVSIQDLQNPQKLAHTLAKSYRQIRQLGL